MSSAVIAFLLSGVTGREEERSENRQREYICYTVYSYLKVLCRFIAYNRLNKDAFCMVLDTVTVTPYPF